MTEKRLISHAKSTICCGQVRPIPRIFRNPLNNLERF